jgi:hypothetical protein
MDGVRPGGSSVDLVLAEAHAQERAQAGGPGPGAAREESDPGL